MCLAPKLVVENSGTIPEFGQHRARRDNDLARPVVGWKLLHKKARGFDLFPIERFL